MQDIYNITTHEEFEGAALELFREQAVRCEPYCEYLRLIGCEATDVVAVEQIPFLPIELFKSHKIYCEQTPPEVIFTSSGAVSSRHYMRSLAEYEAAFTAAFRYYYGDVRGWSIYALLPSYLEREGSSLIYMCERLRELSGGGGGFYLYDHQRLIEDMRRDPRRKILLGVTYALLDLAESGLVSELRSESLSEPLQSKPLGETIIMETGGMKGRREELPREELHRRLSRVFGVDVIHSEFGMAELTSQGYSQGNGLFSVPPWMGVLVRDLSDPFALSRVGRGGLNIIDLASRGSCGFIETQDLGRIGEDGLFTIEGRIEGSDIRGCNLLIE